MKYILCLLTIIVSCSSPNKEDKEYWINFHINELDYHDDLVVTIPSHNFKTSFDSYYFNLDNSINNEDGYNKAKISLSALLKNWINNIKELKDNNVKYLPIDFSDEYIGGFRIELLNNDSLKLQYGFSDDNGFSIYPSNPKEYFNSPKKFRINKDYKDIVVDRRIFIESINKNIERIKNNVR